MIEKRYLVTYVLTTKGAEEVDTERLRKLLSTSGEDALADVVWLELPAYEGSILYNGVAPLPDAAEEVPRG